MWILNQPNDIGKTANPNNTIKLLIWTTRINKTYPPPPNNKETKCFLQINPPPPQISFSNKLKLNTTCKKTKDLSFSSPYFSSPYENFFSSYYSLVLISEIVKLIWHMTIYKSCSALKKKISLSSLPKKNLIDSYENQTNAHENTNDTQRKEKWWWI